MHGCTIIQPVVQVVDVMYQIQVHVDIGHHLLYLAFLIPFGSLMVVVSCGKAPFAKSTTTVFGQLLQSQNLFSLKRK